MAAPPDPEQFERLATRLSNVAQRYEETGNRLVRDVRAMNWVGPKADSFRGNIDSFNGQMKDVSRMLNQLATGMRTGATAIRDAQAKAKKDD